MKWLPIIILVAAIFPALWAAPHAYAADSDVVINEIEANPVGTDSGAEEVELYNLGGDPIDIGGWTISTTAGTAATVTIRDGTVIQPNGYVIVGSDTQWIDNTDEALLLINNAGDTVDTSITFSDEDNDANTWQRSPDGTDKWVFATGTLGGANVGTVDEPEPIPEPEPTPEPEPSNPLTPPQNGGQPSPPPSLTPAPSTQELKIVFIDVGQGSSQLIILPNNMTVLIDGGDRDQSGSVLDVLQDNGVSRIDVMVATHPHADHIGGLIDVINNIDVGEVLDSGQIHTTQAFEDFLDAIDARQIPLASVRQGDTIDLDPEVQLDVLNPPTTLPDGAGDESQFNDNSVVIRLVYGDFSALLTGDMQATNEARLLGTNMADLDSDVLLAGHHGSDTSGSSAFLAAVTPEVVVVSVGANNSYGHPAEETLERIGAAGTQHLMRTDVDGSIVLTTSGGPEYTLETSESGKTVVVPEFETGILVASIALSLVAFCSRSRVWKSLRPA